MDAVESYHRLALDCLKVAAKTQDPQTREDMLRLAAQAKKSSRPETVREQAA
jgi:hypothetical protein